MIRSEGTEHIPSSPLSSCDSKLRSEDSCSSNDYEDDGYSNNDTIIHVKEISESHETSKNPVIHFDTSSGNNGDDMERLNSSSNSLLPSTQPLESTDTDNENLMPYIPTPEKPWAYMSTQSKFYESKEIRGRQFLCGRNPNADYVLNTPKIPKECLPNFSREHFVIEKYIDEDDIHNLTAILYDKSTTGTFINGEKVGKNQHIPLVHGDVISMRTADHPAFKFLLCDVQPVESDSFKTDELRKIVYKKYVIEMELGSGSGGTVYRAYSRNSGLKVAIKVVWKNFNSAENEARILENLRHPCIINVKEVIHGETCLVIVLEYAKGGELFTYVLEDFQKNASDERIAKLQMYQILHATKYMHEKNVCHRDFKLENILMTKKSRTARLKITDFGLSKESNSSQNLRMKTFAGTMSYMAPEIFQGRSTQETYTEKADLWSLGCILFSLLSGYQAFSITDFESTDMLEHKIMNADYSFDGAAWRKVSFRAKDLISKLLVADSSRRYSAKEALEHLWFQSDPEIVKCARKLMDGEQLAEAEILRTFENRKHRKRQRDEDLQQTTKKMLKIDE